MTRLRDGSGGGRILGDGDGDEHGMGRLANGSKITSIISIKIKKIHQDLKVHFMT